jgi:hypothetical protein
MNGGEESESLRGFRYYRRSFLNRPGHHATAFIYATVPFTKAEDEEDSCYPVLTIADCNRSISLSIDCGSGADAKNTLYKLDMLIETLTEFREAVRIECEIQKERDRRTGQVKIQLA